MTLSQQRVGLPGLESQTRDRRDTGTLPVSSKAVNTVEDQEKTGDWKKRSETLKENKFGLRGGEALGHSHDRSGFPILISFDTLDWTMLCCGVGVEVVLSIARSHQPLLPYVLPLPSGDSQNSRNDPQGTKSCSVKDSRLTEKLVVEFIVSDAYILLITTFE